MNVYMMQQIVQDHQQTLANEAEQHRLMQEAQSGKPQPSDRISASIRQIFNPRPVTVEPAKRSTPSIPARNQGKRKFTVGTF